MAKDLKIILENHRPPSWNQIYSSIHWNGTRDKIIYGQLVKGKKGRKQIADEIHDMVRAKLIDIGFKVMSKQHIYRRKVEIDVLSFFDKRPLDSDNIPAKIYIDALKFILLQDDTNEFVGRVSTESFIDADYPRTEIHIREI